MAFNSASFLIFFPIVLLVFYILPEKLKYVWLLISSYYFYMCWNVKYAFLIFISTVITYFSGIILEQIKQLDTSNNKKKLMNLVVAISFILNLSILFFFKYVNLALQIGWFTLTKLGFSISLHQFDLLLPVGISFYTFQALSYTMDVYRDDIYAEKNFLRYALFVSFFPQLVAGPIERSKNLLKQLSGNKKFNFDLAREGLLLMLWGYFLKLVLADRIAIFVDTIYNNTSTYRGYYIILATILFAFQIYCDFAGYSTIAVGASKFLGIELMENFNAPLLSETVAQFWRNWHISLTSWFRDYLYIPLGGSRKGTIRKYTNIMIVFLVSGLWHGASLSFVVWGALNGIYQIVGELLNPAKTRIVNLFRLNIYSFGHRLLKIVCTFILIDFTWIFFRAGTISKALEIIRSISNLENAYVLFNGSIYNCGLSQKEFWIMLLGIVVLLFADYMKKKGIVLRELIIKQDFWFRWLVIDLAIIIILVFGVWGSTYDQANFIYFQF